MGSHSHSSAQLTPALQACANAEAAYTRTLTAASKVKLVGDCDGASVRGALDGFSDLPFMIGQVTQKQTFLSEHGSKHTVAMTESMQVYHMIRMEQGTCAEGVHVLIDMVMHERTEGVAGACSHWSRAVRHHQIDARRGQRSESGVRGHWGRVCQSAQGNR